MAGRRLVDIVAARAFRREVAGRGEAEVDDPLAFRFGENPGAMNRPRGKGAVEFVFREVKRILRQGTVIARCRAGDIATGLMVIRNVRQAFGSRRDRCGIDDYGVALIQMVEQCRQPVLEQRQPVFHSGEAATVADGLV